MQGYIGYIRVSTVKQGTKGVSLEEQRDAISKYAERNQFSIAVWLEEMETAAKQGRPIFNQAIKLLRAREARGIILHKLDRGARNLRDWTTIGDLSDQGVEVHFVSESLDLQSRGGRLSADIQAVVSADYIRNLREETRKGFYGRLKQGFYPLPAPVGYLNHGKAKAKTIDPIMGPLVRKAFELYGTGNYSLETLSEEAHQFGLRSRTGKRVSVGALSLIFHNSFYIGLIRIRKTGEDFPGLHEPLIGKSLFDRVRQVLEGKFNRRSDRHDFLFRRLLTCAQCGYSLVGECQKGHVYYRCHSKECSTSLREESVEHAVTDYLEHLCFSELEMAYLKNKMRGLRESWTTQRDNELKGAKLQLSQLKDRLNRLTDALLDGTIDKELFKDRKNAILMEQKALEEKLATVAKNAPGPDRLDKFLELASTALWSYQNAFVEEKRELLKLVTSNRLGFEKSLELKPSIPFQEIANRPKTKLSGPKRGIPRTLDGILDNLTSLNTQGLLPEFPSLFSCNDDNSVVGRQAQTVERQLKITIDDN